MKPDYSLIRDLEARMGMNTLDGRPEYTRPEDGEYHEDEPTEPPPPIIETIVG